VFIEADAPAKLTKFFTNNATIISPRGLMVNGETAVAAFWTGIFKAGSALM
jgi:ketosteroid isomerase-like protein